MLTCVAYLEMDQHLQLLAFYTSNELVSVFARYGPDCEMFPWALHPPLHWLAGQHEAAKHGVPLQFQGDFQQGNVSKLSQEPLQQGRLWSQQGAQPPEQQDVHEDQRYDAIQR